MFFLKRALIRLDATFPGHCGLLLACYFSRSRHFCAILTVVFLAPLASPFEVTMRQKQGMLAVLMWALAPVTNGRRLLLALYPVASLLFTIQEQDRLWLPSRRQPIQVDGDGVWPCLLWANRKLQLKVFSPLPVTAIQLVSLKLSIHNRQFK